jgi:hypothetical protein
MTPFAPASDSSSRPSRRPGLVAAWRWLLAAGCLGLSAGRASESEDIPLDIGVRSEVNKPFGGFRRKPTPKHGKVYLIAAVNPAPSQLKLVGPVDVRGVAKALRQELNSHGFREITPDQTPEIVLTVVYGRGWLRNPYLADAMVDEMTEPPTSKILGAMPTQLLKEWEPGYESKLQKAQFEKLFIRVTAWKYPSAPKEKPEELWKTTMLVDDPDHRDLNLVCKEMLAAGAPYFDQEIKVEEIEISRPMPDGRVLVGTPEVVKP